MSGVLREDALDLNEDDIIDDPEQDADDGQEDAEDDEVPTFGDDDEAEAQEPTDLVKHLRKEVAERTKAIRDRDRELAELRQPKIEEPIVVGDRPTMEGCDYDQDRFDQELDAWDQRREASREQESRRANSQRDQERQWEQIKANYESKKAALRFPDKAQAESAAFEVLPASHQAIIAKIAPDPALFIYAAGKNPARLNELAAITDPLMLAAAIGRMGATLQIKKKSTAPEPERITRGQPVRNSNNKQLEKLEREADRTGDRTALQAYKKSMAKA